MKRILAIGNSFSEDATYYLKEILDEAGIEAQIVNLHIGGCTLETHWLNIAHNKNEYQFQYNGERTIRKASINKVIQEADWDIIYTQQSSGCSGWSQSYEPFLGLMVDYFRKEASNAKLYLCETWAYTKDTANDFFVRYDKNPKKMYAALKQCYYDAAKRHNLAIIPCGDMIENVKQTEWFKEDGGKYSICRDGFHMNYVYGRYALALQLAKTFFGVDPFKITFVPWTELQPFEIVNEEALNAIKKSII